MGKVLYIEGTSDTDNGDIRAAFNKLLNKELKGKMPRIVMGDGKNQTIDKFHSTPLRTDEERFLLVDSDCKVVDGEKGALCEKFNEEKPNRKMDCTVSNTFFMVQEAEAWILSQPDVLKKNSVNTSGLTKKDVTEITKPSDTLFSLYKNSNLEYHKVSEFVKVFPQLDTVLLRSYFTEFDGLVRNLDL